MNTITKILLRSCLILLFTITTQAQWQQCNGPYGGITKCITSNNNYLFIGTSYGVFRSSNNGSTWMKANSGITDTYIYSLATIDTFLFATTYHDTFRSTNNGDSWIKSDSGKFYTGAYSIFVQDTVLYIGGTGGNRVSYSTDYGLSWKQIYSQSVWFSTNSIAFRDTNLFAGSLGQGVFRLFESGNNWTVEQIGLENYTISALITDSTYLFAGTDTSGIFRTSDNGKNWIQVNSGLPNLRINTLLLHNGSIFACTGKGLYRSTNKGNSWENINSQLSLLDVLTIRSFNTALYIGTQDGIYISTNTGINWRRINSDFISIKISSILTRNQNLYVGTYGSGIFVSSNEGQSWIQLNNGLGDLYVRSLAWNRNTLIAGTNNGVYFSSNLGETWLHLGLEKKYVNTAVVIDAHVFAGTPCCGVYHSSDNGISWNQINNGLSSNEILKLAFNDSFLFVGTWDGGMYRSSNLGNSWEQIDTTNRTSRVFDIVVNDTNVYIAGGADIGFSYSSDNGTTWGKRNNDMTSPIYDIFSFSSNLFAGSYAGKIYLSTNNGLNWLLIGSGLPDSYTGPFAISSQYLFAGTQNAGLWRRPISEILTDIEATPTETSTQLHCYPNPASDVLTVNYTLQDTRTTQPIRYRVVNSMGQTLVECNRTEQQFTIPLSVIPNGVYYIVAESTHSCSTTMFTVVK